MAGHMGDNHLPLDKNPLQGQGPTAVPGEGTPPPSRPPTRHPADDLKQQKKKVPLTTVKIKLVEKVNGKDQPVPWQPYEIWVDGMFAGGGTLDSKGQALAKNIKKGACKVKFPALDDREWKKG